ncbi:MAG: hypothetical protein L6Q60_10885 [Rhodocyclaceae bacterium]|nr:hypothetical protein [Rhodocyclaceae bacterium]
MAEDIVSRADSLMRRRRAFVAAPAATPAVAMDFDVPLLTEEQSPRLPAEDDIPVLTEEVFPDTPAAASTRDKFDEKLAARLASEFALSLERRLAAELPTFVEASLAVLEADLRRGILDIANEAIKDFVARREQLRLPLEENGEGD